MAIPSISLPMDAIQAGRQDPHLLDAVASLYRDVEASLTMLPVCCDACGHCCRFAAYDHRLFVTPLELCHLLASIDDRMPRITEWPESCPFLLDARCSIHPHRLLGCRIFLCRLSEADSDLDLAEASHRRLTRMHHDFGIPYGYIEWGEALRQVSDALNR
jgi:hypothetical protein